MRRLINFTILLVLVLAVGFVLQRSGVIAIPSTASTPSATLSPPSKPARDTLRIAVADRPEALLVGAIKRLLEADNIKIDVVPYNVQTSWLELAAGELDLMIAPLGEAITAQARFRSGRLLFYSGLSTGYDVILASRLTSKPPTTLGVMAGHGYELLATQSFPNAELISAPNSVELEAWLNEGAIQAAILQKASLKNEGSPPFTHLGGTSAERPLPTVVVLSRTLTEPSASSETRTLALLKTLDQWNKLLGYMDQQPELLRSTLKKESDALGIDIDTLFQSYRFLLPSQGRQALIKDYEAGHLKEVLDLLVLARTPNITTPNWDELLKLPSHLESSLTTPEVSQDLPLNPITGSPTPPSPTTPTTIPSSQAIPLLGTNHLPGPAPQDPWPQPIKLTISQALDLPPVVTGNLTGILTARGLEAYQSDGSLAFSVPQNDTLFAVGLLADTQAFYVLTQNEVRAIDLQGQPLWATPLSGQAYSSPVLTPEAIVFLTRNAGGSQSLFALSLGDGSNLWQEALPAPTEIAPTFANAPQPMIITLDAQGQLTSRQASTGSIQWQTKVSGISPLPLAIENSKLSIAFSDGKLSLYSLENGSEIWSSNLKTTLSAGPTLFTSANLVLVPTASGKLAKVSLDTGKVLPLQDISSKALSSAIVAQDRVYLSDETGSLYTLSIKNKGQLVLGKSMQLASQPLQGPVGSSKLWALTSSNPILLIYSP